MNGAEDNVNPFIKQVGKLFEDLAAKQKEKPPVSPRITCTRLRRLREIRCELVDMSNPDMNIVNQTDLESTVAQLNSARTKNESFATWVLRNKQAHQEFSSKQNQLRQEAASNGLTKQLQNATNAFANFSPAALQTVAKNLNTPVTTLNLLASHYRADIRQAVASNTNIVEEIMAALAGDADETVRLTLAGNQSLTRDILLKLCDDPSPLVAEKAKNVLYNQTKQAITNSQENKITEKPAEKQFSDTLTNIPVIFPQISSENAICQTAGTLRSGRKNVYQPEVIEKDFLQVIAERSTTPPRRLAELARHPDKQIRGLVAANPNSTPEILWQLAKDESVDVKKKTIEQLQLSRRDNKLFDE